MPAAASEHSLHLDLFAVPALIAAALIAAVAEIV